MRTITLQSLDESPDLYTELVRFYGFDPAE